MSNSERPRDNRDELLRVTVSGQVAPPRLPIDHAGMGWSMVTHALPGHGGIAHAVHAGDPVNDLIGDHLMVGVSVEDRDERNPAYPGSLHLLSCIGNTAYLGADRVPGVVAGKRGGLAPGAIGPHLISAECPDPRSLSLVPYDPVAVIAVGRGLALIDWPEITLANISPQALDEMPMRVTGERLQIDVQALVPARAIGPGLGQDTWVGDVDISAPELADPSADLRYGDLVAITDLDGRVSRHRASGQISIAVVSHGPSTTPGHGIGLTVLIAGPEQRVGYRVTEGPGLGEWLKAEPTGRSDIEE